MRYIIGFILVIVLVILSFTFVFKGHSNTPTPAKPANITTYAQTGTVVQYTVDGVVNADKTHRSIEITVGEDQTSVKIYQGYQGNVISSSTNPNNYEAYNVFLHALALEDYTKTLTTTVTDNTGICPTGQRYYFKIIGSDGSDIQNNWSASCVAGTFGGDLGKVQALFQAQIPDYSVATNNVNLN
jgi:hypothetical protein